MTTLLDRIVESTRQVVAEARRRVPLRTLVDQIASRSATMVSDGRLAARSGFRMALESSGINIIAEVKRRSPVKGVLLADFDPAAIAAAYERGGAAAISVLTEHEYFGGALEHLEAVRQVVRVPILRKDFVIDLYQVIEAAALGADAVLLIAAILDDGELASLMERCAGYGLEALVEVHTRSELDRALDCGATIVGINNRDLATFRVDLATSLALIEEVPDDVVAVSESGLGEADELARLRAAGFDAFLIGERLVRQADPDEALRVLRERAAALLARAV